MTSPILAGTTTSGLKGGQRPVTPNEQTALVSRLRGIALRVLEGMYRPREGLFVFRLKKAAEGIVYESLSHRYTAIVLIALAGEEGLPTAGILGGQTPFHVCQGLARRVADLRNIGDLALTLWACRAVGQSDRRPVLDRVLDMDPLAEELPTVEAAWTLKALCVDYEAEVSDLRERLAQRLMSVFSRASGIFPHFMGNGRSFRSHVACFADQIYPIQALAAYHAWSGDRQALEVAVRCADKMCELQGPAGQWWWHYHRLTGNIVEGYPVYSVHQYGMAPMALFELHEAGGPDYSAEVSKGLAWMLKAPEIDRSLIAPGGDAIWRKVDRRGLRKFCRYAKALVSRLHTDWRMSALDRLFPPLTVDYECRPYSLGWLLCAWPGRRIQKISGGGF